MPDLETPVREGITTFMTFIPKLIGFLLILLLGYLVAKLVAKAVNAVLERIGFDRAVERGGVKKALAKSKYDASDIVAKLAFYAVFIPFLSAAVGALGIQALQDPLAAFIALIPRIIVAIVLVVIGAVIAGTVKSFITNALGGLSYGSILANAAAVLILFGFVKSALDQVGIATGRDRCAAVRHAGRGRRCGRRGCRWRSDPPDAAPLGGPAGQGRHREGQDRRPVQDLRLRADRHVRHGRLPGRPDRRASGRRTPPVVRNHPGPPGSPARPRPPARRPAAERAG
jgi:hypothetical protein